MAAVSGKLLLQRSIYLPLPPPQIIDYL